LTASIPAGAVTDAFGNPNAAFSGNYSYNGSSARHSPRTSMPSLRRPCPRTGWPPTSSMGTAYSGSHRIRELLLRLPIRHPMARSSMIRHWLATKNWTRRPLPMGPVRSWSSRRSMTWSRAAPQLRLITDSWRFQSTAARLMTSFWLEAALSLADTITPRSAPGSRTRAASSMAAPSRTGVAFPMAARAVSKPCRLICLHLE
jgi:hypothetical protein